MTCKECKKRHICIVACEEVNAQLNAMEDAIEKLDYLPPKKAQPYQWID